MCGFTFERGFAVLPDIGFNFGAFFSLMCSKLGVLIGAFIGLQVVLNVIFGAIEAKVKAVRIAEREAASAKLREARQAERRKRLSVLDSWGDRGFGSLRPEYRRHVRRGYYRVRRRVGW